jgi:hypothetical protein
LSQGCLYPFSLLNLRSKLVIGRRKLGRTIRDPSFQFLV